MTYRNSKSQTMKVTTSRCFLIFMNMNVFYLSHLFWCYSSFIITLLLNYNKLCFK